MNERSDDALVMEVHVSNWYAFDTYQERGHVVQAYGRNRDGRSVCVEMERYVPSVLVWLGNRQNSFYLRNADDFVRELKRRFFHETRGLSLKVNFVMKKRLFPYTSVHAEKFMKLSFESEYSRKKTTDVLRALGNDPNERLMNHGNFKLYDASNLSSLLMLQHERRILPNGWIRVRSHRFDSSRTRTTCDYHVVVPYDTVECLHECNDTGAFRIVSFDLECFSHASHSTGESIFPDHRQRSDTVSQIGVCTWTVGIDPYEKRVFVLDAKNFFGGTKENVDDGTTLVVPCRNESDLILAFARYVNDVDADILAGYNIFGFDYEYLYERARLLGIQDELVRTLSRRTLSDKDKTQYAYSTRKLSTNAYGDNTFKLITVAGRASLDLYVLVKKEHKLESYKLDAVSEHFIGQHKVDLKPAEMFECLMRSKESILRVAEYCEQDCVLVIDLIRRLSVLPNLLEMANITRVTIDALILRGQQIKCYSLITYEAFHDNYAVPDKIDCSNRDHRKGKRKQPARDYCDIENEGEADDDIADEGGDKYMGATVLEPKKGVYMNERITVLDFASLYPSLVIAYNLCFSTLVFQPSSHALPQQESFETTTVNVKEGTNHVFVKNRTREGLLPKILKKLWQQRKMVKRMMKETDDSDVLSVLNGRQLAIKVSMNSIYGFCGATNGMLPCRPIAESITALGRDHIALAKTKVEEMYRCTVVYGDSDSIYVHFHDATTTERAFEISNEAQNRLNDLFVKPVEIEFEKVYFPFVLLTKKRYCALVWETPDERKTHTEYKGISIVRRDFCRFTRETLDECMQIVLNERDVQKAYDHISSRTRDLLRGNVPNSKLVMSKLLSAKYAKDESSNPMPHVAVMVKMRRRDPNNYPKSGERVPFLYVNNGERLLKDRAEHPAYVEENDLAVDHMYYLENQIRKPCEELFNFLLSPEKFDPYRYVTTEVYLMRRQQQRIVLSAANVKNNQHEITRFFSRKPK